MVFMITRESQSTCLLPVSFTEYYFHKGKDLFVLGVSDSTPSTENGHLTVPFLATDFNGSAEVSPSLMWAHVV